MSDDDKTRILTAEDAARWGGPAQEAEKTRVLTAEDAAQILGKPGDGGVDREPTFDGKRIVFFCSNGHKITVDVSLAGKAGKCSKQGCGVPVQIPSPPGAAQPAKSARAAKPPRTAAAPSPAPVTAPEIVIAPPIAEPAAEGPDTLVVDAPARPPAPPVASPAGDEPSFDFIPGGATADAGPVAGAGAEAEAWTFDLDQIDHPTARLVARLWQERAHGGVVEVHLSGGGVIMPEWYDPQWSCGTHAVFAALAADGSVTLTAVAWDQIQRVVVRQVQGTPDGMFEG